MKYQKIFYAVLITIIILSCSWVYILYIPNTEYISQARFELNNYNKKLNASSNTNDQLQKMQSQLNIKAVRLEEIESKLIAKSDLDAVIRKLVTKMAAQNIKVIDVTPSKSHFLNESDAKVRRDYMSKLPLEMVLEARFMALGNFLENLDSLPFWLQADAIQISLKPKGGQNLSINLRASIYLKTDSSL
jgi:Tfp pilus assembly protein PilO